MRQVGWWWTAVFSTVIFIAMIGCSSDGDVFVVAQDFDEEVPFYSEAVEDTSLNEESDIPLIEEPCVYPPEIYPDVPSGELADTDPAGPDASYDAVASFYARDYSVSLDEAQRRLDRIQPLQEILASIRDLEGGRLAGWGIDHGPNFGGWVLLTGDTAPGGEAACIAAAYADVEIRTGADYSLAELLAAQQRLFRNDTTGYPEPSVAPMVTYTGIDMAANAVRIGIDPALAAVPPVDPVGSQPASVPDEEFQAKAAEVTELLRDLISVNFVIEDGRGLSID